MLMEFMINARARSLARPRTALAKVRFPSKRKVREIQFQFHKSIFVLPRRTHRKASADNRRFALRFLIFKDLFHVPRRGFLSTSPPRQVFPSFLRFIWNPRHERWRRNGKKKERKTQQQEEAKNVRRNLS